MPQGKAFHGQWGCHTDEMLPSLAAVAEIIHGQGSKAILQIHHGGRMSPASLLGQAPVSASAVPAIRPDADVPVAMSEKEIHETISAFGAATKRAYDAGYDGVELRGSHLDLSTAQYMAVIKGEMDRTGLTNVVVACPCDLNNP